MMNELVAFLVRETGWTLDYIRELPIAQLQELAREFTYQKSMDEYKAAHNAALIVCTLASSKQHRYKPEEIIGRPPKKEKSMADLMQVKITKLTLADGKEYELAPLTLNIMGEVEDKFGMSFFDLIGKRQTKGIRFIVYLRLKKKYPELTEEIVGELITVDTLNEIGKLYGIEG